MSKSSFVNAENEKCDGLFSFERDEFEATKGYI